MDYNIGTMESLRAKVRDLVFSKLSIAIQNEDIKNSYHHHTIGGFELYGVDNNRNSNITVSMSNILHGSSITLTPEQSMYISDMIHQRTSGDYELTRYRNLLKELEK